MHAKIRRGFAPLQQFAREREHNAPVHNTDNDAVWRQELRRHQRDDVNLAAAVREVSERRRSSRLVVIWRRPEMDMEVFVR